jgi:pseudouridine synthase
MALERLQKILAHAGVASRRAAELLIREGRVSVNGRVVTELGSKADPERDHVKVGGKLITRAENPVYLLLHKPGRVVTTMRDPEGRPCVAAYLRGVRARVYPVGRLDFESEGLLLLTNDGGLAARLMHPSGGVERIYEVKIKGQVPEKDLERLRRGVYADGERLAAERIRLLRRSAEKNAWLEVVLREGKNRHVRRMVEALGHDVLALRRVAYGPLRLGRLPRGAMRPLSRDEVEALRRCVSSFGG